MSLIRDGAFAELGIIVVQNYTLMYKQVCIAQEVLSYKSSMHTYNDSRRLKDNSLQCTTTLESTRVLSTLVIK